MKVLVTGGTGDVGKAVTARLVKRGYSVRIIGLDEDFEVPGAEYATCNIMDYDKLCQHMRGCEAVVHLAAIRSPTTNPAQETFLVNTAGTFNVFEAAARAGIGRIVQASSINALGCAWSITDVAPQYFPVDEDHPTYTTDPYSFSKRMVEDIAAYYWRREGISSVSLRFPWVYPQGYLETPDFRQRQQHNLTTLDSLLAQSETERRPQLDEANQSALDYRQRRQMEFPATQGGNSGMQSQYEPLLWMANLERYNYWAFVDERDSAQAIEKGITADYEGSHALFINDHTNSAAYETRDLIRLFYPDVKQVHSDLQGAESLVSINKARALIGFEPEHSIRSL